MISKEHAANYANHNMDGIYYNGGSWMRIEICGYVTGKLHGWSKADKAIANRLWAEIHADEGKYGFDAETRLGGGTERTTREVEGLKCRASIPDGNQFSVT